MTSAKIIDNQGGSVSLPDMGMVLTIPPDALKESTKVSVTFDPCEKHQELERDQLVLGPVISCKPDGMEFSKPVTFSVPHAGYKITERNIQVWCKHKSDEAPVSWEKIYDGSSGHAEDDVMVRVDGDRIKMRVKCFTLYSFVTAAITTLWSQPGLILEILAYMDPVNVKISRDVKLIVYAVKRGDLASRRLVEAEEKKKNESALCCSPWTYVLNPSGNNLKVTAKNTKPADKWLPDDSTTKAILYDHIQAGGIGSRCEIKFRQNSAIEKANYFEGSFQTVQDGNADTVETIYFDDSTAKRHLESDNGNEQMTAPLNTGNISAHLNFEI